MLHLLPTRSDGAAGNMATDFLLHSRYPEPDAARFRHYSWRMPAMTFGYSQRWEQVRKLAGEGRELCRRPTGGGIVDHENDWTYSLVIPRKNELWKQPAPLVYYLIHRMIADLLVDLGEDVVLQQDELRREKAAGPGVCFQQAEPHDVVMRLSGVKVAGAALKRNKNGLLMQGSIVRGPLKLVDWERFESNLHCSLAEVLSLSAAEQPWPDFDPAEEMHLIDQFSNPEWNERR